MQSFSFFLIWGEFVLELAFAFLVRIFSWMLSVWFSVAVRAFSGKTRL